MSHEREIDQLPDIKKPQPDFSSALMPETAHALYRIVMRIHRPELMNSPPDTLLSQWRFSVHNMCFFNTASMINLRTLKMLAQDGRA